MPTAKHPIICCGYLTVRCGERVKEIELAELCSHNSFQKVRVCVAPGSVITQENAHIIISSGQFSHIVAKVDKFALSEVEQAAFTQKSATIAGSVDPKHVFAGQDSCIGDWNALQVCSGGTAIKYLSVQFKNRPDVFYIWLYPGGIGNCVSYFSYHNIFSVAGTEKILRKAAVGQIYLSIRLKLERYQIAWLKNGSQI